jgi:RNA polymerase sigma-70 factor (ECF subfamily)
VVKADIRFSPLFLRPDLFWSVLSIVWAEALCAIIRGNIFEPFIMEQAILATHPLAAALEHSLGMFVVTDRTGRAVYANEGATRRTGYAVAETIGQKPGRLWGGHMPRPFYTALWEDLLQSRPVVADIDNQRKDGARYRERVHITPLVEPSGEARFFLAAQPFHLETLPAMERFSSDFRELFGAGRAVSVASFGAWLGRWFAPETGPFYAVEPDSLSLAEVIESECVRPLQVRFAVREEDRRLVEAAKADAREFRTLYLKYEPLVQRYFWRHLAGEPDTSQDLTQETFYRALVALPGFTTTNASYGTYLLRVAHNLLVNHYRKKQTLALFDDAASEERASVVWPSFFSAERVFEAPSLRPGEREVLSMKYREGFSVQEIAVLLGISENAVKLRLSRARKHLREIL